MKSWLAILKNEDGSVMIASVLILALLTIVGISATDTTTVERHIASNDQFHKMAFYNADSGVYTTPKLISRSINTSEVVPTGTGNPAAGIQYQVAPSGTDPAGTPFYRQIMGYDTYDGGNVDIQFALDGRDVDVDVQRLRAQNLAGGGAEFASGSEGIGVGSAGGVAIFYGLNSQGQGPRSALSRVGAVYRKVVGVAGGL